MIPEESAILANVRTAEPIAPTTHIYIYLQKGDPPCLIN